MARDHINSFPRVESHYCRASTIKQYLDSTLSVELMYCMYCKNYKDRSPVSLHMYREIFNTEFNLEFHLPKKDRCDYCEEYRVNPSEADAENIVTMRDQKMKQKVRQTTIDRDIVAHMQLFASTSRMLYVCLELTLRAFTFGKNFPSTIWQFSGRSCILCCVVWRCTRQGWKWHT